MRYPVTDHSKALLWFWPVEGYPDNATTVIYFHPNSIIVFSSSLPREIKDQYWSPHCPSITRNDFVISGFLGTR